MHNRIVAAGIALSLALVVGACGGDDGDAGGGETPTTGESTTIGSGEPTTFTGIPETTGTTEPTDTTDPSDDPSEPEEVDEPNDEDASAARAANIQPGDVPADFVSEEPSPDQNASFNGEGDCAYLGEFQDIGSTTAIEDSDDYNSPDDSLNASSSIRVYVSADDASEAFSTIAQDTTAGCLEEDFSASLGPAPTDEASITITPVDLELGDEAVGYQFDATLSAGSQKVVLQGKLAFVRVGRALAFVSAAEFGAEGVPTTSLLTDELMAGITQAVVGRMGPFAS